MLPNFVFVKNAFAVVIRSGLAIDTLTFAIVVLTGRPVLTKSKFFSVIIILVRNRTVIQLNFAHPRCF